MTINPVITFNPAANSTFPLGDTTVTVRATDTAGNSTTATFTVTVQDTIAPLVVPPPDFVAEATSAQGVVVSYPVAATATDAVTAHPVIAYDPPAGSTLPLGNTVVTVSATDAAHNTGTASFNVTVRQTTLLFSVQPTSVIASNSITPAVVVSFVDQNGNVETDVTASVTLSIATNAGGGTLSGTLTVPAVSGVAVFSNLSIDKEGYGYTLRATSSAFAPTISTAFTIHAPPPVITSPQTLTYVAGMPFNYTITATNHPSSFSAAPVPPGLTLDIFTGTITGSITTPDVYTIILGAADSGELGTATLVITVLGGIDALHVTDVSNTDNAASDPPAAPATTSLIVATGSDNLAHISINVDISDANPDLTKYLWRIDGAGATPISGNFSTNPSLAALQQSGVTYVISSGYDQNQNGVLDASEIQHQVTVNVVTLNWVTPSGSSMPLISSTTQVSDPRPALHLTVGKSDVVINRSSATVTIRGFIDDPIANDMPRVPHLADIESVNVSLNGQTSSSFAVSALAPTQFGKTPGVVFSRYPYMGKIASLSKIVIPIAAGQQLIHVETSPNAAGNTGFADVSIFFALDSASGTWKVTDMHTTSSPVGSYAPMILSAKVAPLSPDSFNVAVAGTSQGLRSTTAGLYNQDGPVVAIRSPGNSNQVNLLVYDSTQGPTGAIKLYPLAIDPNQTTVAVYPMSSTIVSTGAAGRDIVTVSARAQTPVMFNSLVFPHKHHPPDGSAATWQQAPSLTLLVRHNGQTGTSYFVHMESSDDSSNDESDGISGSFDITMSQDSSPFSFPPDDDSVQYIDPIWNPGSLPGVYTKLVKPPANP